MAATRPIAVTVRERTDRTVHEVTVSHRESRKLARAFGSTDDLVRYIFDALLAGRAKGDIPSAFALKDLLAHEPDLARDLDERAEDSDEGIRDSLMETSASR